MAITTFKGTVRATGGFISGVANRIPSTAAAVSLTPADNGETTVLNNSTAVITLPAASAGNIGLTYSFLWGVNATAGQKIKTITNSPGDVFVGGVYSAASGGAATLFTPNGTTEDVINLGGALGGQVGSKLTVQCTAVNRWEVSGDLIALTAPTTPFAAA